jgi:hypothetical protein
MQLTLPPYPIEAKFVLDLVPSESEVHNRALAQAEVKLLLAKANRILVQDIFVQQFSETVAPAAIQTIQANVKEQFNEKYGGAPVFRIITARLTCQPSDRCIFTRVRAAFDLGRDGDAVRPIACTLFPDSKADVVTIKNSIEVSNELTIKVAKTGSKGTHATEYERREYQIRVRGGFSPEPAWEFKATHQEREIAGDLTLMMVVVSPEALTSACEMSVSAEAKVGGFPGIPLITRRDSKNPTRVPFSI